MKNSILFLTNAYPDFDSSYRGVFVKKMASFLLSDGCEISVVTPKIYKRSRYFERQNGIKVYRFPFFARDRLLIEHDKIPYLRMILYYITGVLFTVYVIMRRQCGLIHVHWAIPTGPIAVLVGAVLRKPVVVTIHGSDFRLAMGKSSFLKKIFLWVCRRARHLHCVSGVMQTEMEMLGVDKEKISTFPMGVDEGFFERGRNRKRDLNGLSFTIVSNRNFLPIYNVSLFIRAIPKVLEEEREAKFIIAGGGPERQDLEKEAKDLNIGSHVEFLGRIAHEKMPALLGQTDIYVSTSLFDGTSVSLLEALASGAFPVVSDIPSNREWITDGKNGFLVPTNEEAFLAKKIIEAIRNKALLKESRLENLRVAEEKALWPRIMEKVKRIYKESLHSGN
jgi:glycosyltransferase involved in cell wall biosynthesis